MSENQNSSGEQAKNGDQRVRLVIVAVTVVVGLIVAAVPLIASLSSSSSTSSTSSNDAGSTSAESTNGAREDVSAVTVDHQVQCPSADGAGSVERAGEAQTQLATDAELKDVTLPCLTMGNAPSTQSMAQLLAGKVSVVNVWAWWCGPCRDELPLMQQTRDNHPEWNVVGVHMAEEAQAGVDFLKELNAIDLPSFQDSSHTFDSATEIPKVVPITLVYRPDGTRAATFTKAFTSEDELVNAVNTAING